MAKDTKAMHKLRLEECENGWTCSVGRGSNEFITRKIFNSTKELCEYLTSEFPDKKPDAVKGAKQS